MLATETPGGRGAGKRTECNVQRASSALLRKSSSSGAFLLERIYFTSLSKMSPSIFSSVRGMLTFNQRSGPRARRAYVTDMLLSSKIQRWQLSWIYIWVHIAFINYLFLLPCPFAISLYDLNIIRFSLSPGKNLFVFTYFCCHQAFSFNPPSRSIRICKGYSLMSRRLFHVSF